MRVRFGRRKKIQFTDRRHPVMGIISVILGVGVLVSLVSLCVISEQEKGNAGIEIGIFGFLSMIISIIAFIMSLRCYRQEDVYKVAPTIGSVLNGMLIILFLLLFFIGAM